MLLSLRIRPRSLSPSSELLLGKSFGIKQKCDLHGETQLTMQQVCRRRQRGGSGMCVSVYWQQRTFHVKQLASAVGSRPCKTCHNAREATAAATEGRGRDREGSRGRGRDAGRSGDGGDSLRLLSVVVKSCADTCCLASEREREGEGDAVNLMKTQSS